MAMIMFIIIKFVTRFLTTTQYYTYHIGVSNFVCLFDLMLYMSKSTAMVISGQSVHLTTLFSWASLTKRLTSTSCTYFRL